MLARKRAKTSPTTLRHSKKPKLNISLAQQIDILEQEWFGNFCLGTNICVQCRMENLQKCIHKTRSSKEILNDLKILVERVEGVSLLQKRLLHNNLFYNSKRFKDELEEVISDNSLKGQNKFNNQKSYMQVHLARNNFEFQNGYGEKILVFVSKKTLIDSNLRKRRVCVGILVISSIYKEWFHLNFGDPIVFELRENSAVAFVNQLETIKRLEEEFHRNCFQSSLKNKNFCDIIFDK